jgi:hypothetical protein
MNGVRNFKGNGKDMDDRERNGVIRKSTLVPPKGKDAA